MKLEKLAGATSEIWQIFVRDSSSTTGGGLTGLVFNTASLTAYYHRDTDTTATAISLVTMTVGTFTSSGFKEIDSTDMPGWYQFCPPNAAIASGAKSCAFHLKGATNMAPLPIEVQLLAVNPDSATAFMTSVATVTTVTNQLTAAQIATGVWQDTTPGDFTTSASVGKSVMNGVALGTGLTINDLTTKTGYSLSGTQTFNNTGTWTGNIVGTLSTLTTYTGNTLQTGDAFGRLGAPVGASISADIAGVPTTVWATVMTGTTTAIQSMRGFIAALLGKSSGLDLGSPTYRNIADTKNVITSTSDANGNRSVVTLDLT